MAKVKFHFQRQDERTKDNRQEAKDFGKLGEDIATAYLEKHGYAIVERNDRLHHWEVDIIALKDGVLHFVEVKSRMSESFQSAEAAVDARKARRIMTVADRYIKSHKRTEPAQIDIIAVVKNGDSFTIRHTENVFNAMTLPFMRLNIFRGNGLVDNHNSET